MSNTSLSVHLTEQSIRITDAVPKGQTIELLELSVEKNLPQFLTVMTDKSTGDVAKVIEKMISGMKTKKRNVNIVLPDSISYSQIVEMPKLKEKELLSAIKYQADQFIPMPIDKTTLDIEILYENPATHTLLVLIVAASEEIIKKIEKLLELSGLVPDSIENELSAAGRMISQFYSPTGKTGGTIFVNLGQTSSSLYFFDHALNLIVTNHTFNLGTDLYRKEIQANLNTDEKKAQELVHEYGLGTPASASLDTVLEPVTLDIAREIGKFTIAVREKHAGAAIQSVLFFGEIDEVPGLVKKLGSHSTVPVSIFSLEKQLVKNPLTASYASHLSSLTCVIGGALR